MKLNQEQVKAIIPHRDPFLFIDEVIELEEGKKCKAIWNIKEDAFWVPGHFPGNPVLPGVLQVEALAQAGAIAVLSLEQFKGKIGYFAKIDKVTFKRMVKPGDVLELETELVRIKGPIGIGKGRATVNGELVVECELTFAVK